MSSSPTGFIIGVTLAAVVVTATITFLAYIYFNRRMRLKNEHHLSVLTRGQSDLDPPHIPPGPLPTVIRVAPPSHGPTVLPLSPPAADPWMPQPVGVGPRGVGAHGPGSVGRPDRPPLGGYYAPAPAAVSGGGVGAEAAPPVGGYYAPVLAPAPAALVAGPGSGMGGTAKYA